MAFKGRIFPEDISVYRERKYGNSRFNLISSRLFERRFLEVKEDDQEADNIVRFPDAPTKRGKACAGADPMHERRI